jgi:serine/threonine protein kinase
VPDNEAPTERATGAAAPATVPSVDLVGETIADVYAIERRLGFGGMGVVYLARHVRLGHHVALKCIHPGVAPDALATRRFLQEARAAGQIRHDNVVQVLDGGQLEDGFPYIVMEYLEGESLSALVEREGPLVWRRVAHVMAQISGALAAAHRVGIVHRDIKPANCFRVQRTDDPDCIKVLDFGLAKLAPELREHSESFTSTGVIMGTPGYIAPEVYRGFRADARSDIYALGVLTYRLLEGELPPFRIPDTALSRAPASLRAVILRCLSHDPEDRYPNAELIHTAILGLLNVPTDGPTGLIDSATSATATQRRSVSTPTASVRPRWVWLVALVAASAGLWGLVTIVNNPPNAEMPAAAGRPDAPAPTGQLHLEVTPPHAVVVVDGAEIPGTDSPRIISGLSAASHRVRVASDEFYLPFEQLVAITAGETTLLPVRLRHRDVTVSVATGPIDAEIKLVEGTSPPIYVARGSEPFKIRRLPGVQYKVIAERAGYEPRELPLTFSGEQTEGFELVLRPLPGGIADRPASLTVEVKKVSPKKAAKSAELKIAAAYGLPPATVWVDDVPQPKPTPITVKVVPGTHTVKWKYPDGKSVTKKISIADGDSKVFRGEL